ncbi:shikimate dehydrogenase [Shewanella waksmanii]|uniref:shikimate dehydrogenase n=1 Tax=Shewanella waksmanii TaxID=213783 RepID=UPI0004904A7B|nr:shikimate dehydrogenase [Shewanella waksmanii]
MTDKYAVFGNPISHSKSPHIHHSFAEQTQQAISYTTIAAPTDDFADSLSQFWQSGGCGANVTMPFKEQAFALCDQLTEEAQLAGAVNTLTKLPNGEIHGDTTDGFGLVTDLQRQFGHLKGKRVLLLGAGGAARGSILALLNSGIASLCIHNRTMSKAEDLAQIFTRYGEVSANSLIEPQTAFDIIINSTSASLNGQALTLPPWIIAQHTVCYDMAYAKETTAFNLWAQQHNAAQTSDGLGMLVGQAAKSFQHWRKVMPQVEPVLASLRQQLS